MHLPNYPSGRRVEADRSFFCRAKKKDAKKAKWIITLIFILSIVYNLVGMYFATQALLSPMVAAILMPISSISIVALSALLSYSYAKPIRG